MYCNWPITKSQIKGSPAWCWRKTTRGSHECSWSVYWQCYSGNDGCKKGSRPTAHIAEY